MQNSIFYHIYPLGLCGAPRRNDFQAQPIPRLETLHDWIPHLRALNVNALYLGPLFESSAHGYDTADFFHVDRRLGTNETLAHLSEALHENGIRLVLDGVFHHVGRDFRAFRDLLQNGESSTYRHWFSGVDFSRRSSYNDPFAYDGWAGNFDLVKLNLHEQDVRQHIFSAIKMWVDEFNIDGLRLDVADKLDMDFLRALSSHCHNLRPDFWLMGEVIQGDYNHWVNPQTLDSVTNYECYKGLYSSHVDKNYFEIAYALNRQSGHAGIYRNKLLYNFVDNHDVNRLASNLTNPAHLYTTYGLLFTMPGIPSIYYGSEWGVKGIRTKTDDAGLRPPMELKRAQETAPHPDLPALLAKLAHIRSTSSALQRGDYAPLQVKHEQFAFARFTEDEYVVVALNASAKKVSLELNVPLENGCKLHDMLNTDQSVSVENGKIHVEIDPHWAVILR